MGKISYNITIGGPAGAGSNILSNIFGRALGEIGYYVFYSRDYQSLIRGGHNFNVLTFSDAPVKSNTSKIDVLVCLDKDTEKKHKKDMGKNSVILKDSKNNMYYAGQLFKLFGLDFNLLEKEIKTLDKKRYKENIESAENGYSNEKRVICTLKKINNKNIKFMNGSQGISDGAVKSGLDIYYAYPMTPATPVLTELAQMQENGKFKVIELENEIAIVNAGIGSAITGALTMVGTSGGGFDLMSEGLSLTGIAGVPLVFYLAQRPGPGTGVATYTAQGDLNLARHAGHGEFNRVVLAPGDANECIEIVNQAFYFSQKFKIPSIVISDKHLAESFYSFTENSKITSVKKSTSIKRYSSYEQNPLTGSATEDPEIINKNIEKRMKTKKEIISEAKKLSMYELHGDKNSRNVVLSWGSTKGAIIDAIKGLNAEFIQIKYIEPFPYVIKKIIEKKNLILVENNSTGQLGNLISEKTGIFIEDKNKILRYDGRPFLADELKKEIQRRIK